MILSPSLQLHLVETWEDAEAYTRWLDGMIGQPLMGCDTETGGLEWYQLPLRTIQFGDLNHGWTIPHARWGGLAHETFKRFGNDIVFHNAKFDLLFLEDNGYDVGRHRVHDSFLLARTLMPHRWCGLKDLSTEFVDSRAEHLEKELKVAMMKGKWDWGTVPIELPQYWTYAASDPVFTYALWRHLERQMEYVRQPYEIDLANSMIVLDMEQRGQMVDIEYCRWWSETIARFEDEINGFAHSTYGTPELSKDEQLIRYLEGQGVKLTKRTDKGKIALDKFVLQEIDHPVADLVLRYRQANKRRTTYFDPWLRYERDHRIHPSFNISGARTARMSSERPNLQNVPRSRKVRRGLVARAGHVLVLADYDQIELRLMAHFARSQPMIDAIHAGEDLHSYTAKLVYQVEEPTFEQRRVAKHSNFAKIYGAGLAKFATTAGVSIEEAQHFLSGYDVQFPEVRRYQTEVSTLAHRSGAASPDGLAHLFSERTGRQQVADPKEAYKLVNYNIQGEAADVLKLKMIDLDMNGYSDHLTIPIHDELAFEVPDDVVDDFVHGLPAVMEDRDSYVVPLTVGVEVVRNWGEKYEEGT